VQNKLEEKLGATECESAVEQYQEMCDLKGKTDRKARKPWIM
jgi:hypothetical protein